MKDQGGKFLSITRWSPLVPHHQAELMRMPFPCGRQFRQLNTSIHLDALPAPDYKLANKAVETGGEDFMQSLYESDFEYSGDTAFNVDQESGYLAFLPGKLRGFQAMHEACLGIIKQRCGPLSSRGKKAYLQPLLYQDDFLVHPEIVLFCLDEKLLAAASAYLGEPPCLRSIQLFWTPQNETESGSQRWHFDHVGERQLKLFVYLSPVDEQTGPFTFLPAHICDRMLAEIGKTREEANTARFSDSDLDGRIDKGNIIKLLGPAGAGGMVDTTRCMHYGGRTRHGERRMMIIQYTRPQDNIETVGVLRPQIPDNIGLTDLQRAALDHIG